MHWIAPWMAKRLLQERSCSHVSQGQTNNFKLHFPFHFALICHLPFVICFSTNRSTKKHAMFSWLDWSWTLEMPIWRKHYGNLSYSMLHYTCIKCLCLWFLTCKIYLPNKKEWQHKCTGWRRRTRSCFVLIQRYLQFKWGIEHGITFVHFAGRQSRQWKRITLLGKASSHLVRGKRPLSGLNWPFWMP
jgi:hypothetical protein